MLDKLLPELSADVGDHLEDLQRLMKHVDAREIGGRSQGPKVPQLFMWHMRHSMILLGLVLQFPCELYTLELHWKPNRDGLGTRISSSGLCEQIDPDFCGG